MLKKLKHLLILIRYYILVSEVTILPSWDAYFRSNFDFFKKYIVIIVSKINGLDEHRLHTCTDCSHLRQCCVVVEVVTKKIWSELGTLMFADNIVSVGENPEKSLQ